MILWLSGDLIVSRSSIITCVHVDTTSVVYILFIAQRMY